MVTFPRKKYFPWPLESATPKLCRETKQTLKSMTLTGIDLQVNFIFHFHISISCSVNNFFQVYFQNPTDYSWCWCFLDSISCFSVISDWKCNSNGRLPRVFKEVWQLLQALLASPSSGCSCKSYVSCSSLPPYAPLPYIQPHTALSRLQSLGQGKINPFSMAKMNTSTATWT